MSKITLAALFGAIALIALAIIFEVSFMAGTSGVLFIAALVYSYHVAKRDVELLAYAMEHRDEDQYEDRYDDRDELLLTEVAR